MHVVCSCPLNEFPCPSQENLQTQAWDKSSNSMNWGKLRILSNLIISGQIQNRFTIWVVVVVVVVAAAHVAGLWGSQIWTCAFPEKTELATTTHPSRSGWILCAEMVSKFSPIFPDGVRPVSFSNTSSISPFSASDGENIRPKPLSGKRLQPGVPVGPKMTQGEDFEPKGWPFLHLWLLWNTMTCLSVEPPSLQGSSFQGSK